MAHLPPLIGCSGWSEAKAKYFAHFATIEVQNTFYEPPSTSLAGKWRALAPASFHFCVKAWQLITHTPSSPTYRRLKSQLSPAEHDLVGSFRPTEQVKLAWERTATVARILDAHVVLFQCPASFSPEPANVENLQRFFSEICRGGFKLAWEPRGNWPPDLVSRLCQDLDLLHCIDPFTFDRGETCAPYWRLHGRGGYSYRYSDADLDELVDMLHLCAGNDSSPQYIFFNNIWMKDDALRFEHRVRARTVV